MKRVEATDVMMYSQTRGNQNVQVIEGKHPETGQRIYAILYPHNTEIGFIEGEELERDPVKMLLG